MTQSGEMVTVIKEAADVIGRHVTVLREAGAAPDHPID